jgi:hypothetical protein
MSGDDKSPAWRDALELAAKEYNRLLQSYDLTGRWPALNPDAAPAAQRGLREVAQREGIPLRQVRALIEQGKPHELPSGFAAIIVTMFYFGLDPSGGTPGDDNSVKSVH